MATNEGVAGLSSGASSDAAVMVLAAVLASSDCNRVSLSCGSAIFGELRAELRVFVGVVGGLVA